MITCNTSSAGIGSRQGAPAMIDHYFRPHSISAVMRKGIGKVVWVREACWGPQFRTWNLDAHSNSDWIRNRIMGPISRRASRIPSSNSRHSLFARTGEACTAKSCNTGISPTGFRKGTILSWMTLNPGIGNERPAYGCRRVRGIDAAED